MPETHHHRTHRSKGAIIVDKVDFKVSDDFQAARDLNLRPIAYTIFAMTLMFIIFITYLISQHEPVGHDADVPSGVHRW